MKEIPKDPSTQVPKDPKTQRPKDPSTQRPKYPKTQVPKDPKTQRPKDPKTQRPKGMIASQIGYLGIWVFRYFKRIMPLTELFLSPNRFIIFVLVLTRISGVVMTAPILSSRAAPMRVRAMLALGLSLLIAPMQLGATITAPGTMIDLLVMMVGEAIIGLSIGLGMMILLSGIQLTGNIVGQMSGAQIADIFDPTFDQSVPIYAQLLDVVMLSVFLIIGGHREVMDALLSTFGTMPLGGGGFNDGIAAALIDIVSMSFAVGIRAAAPAMVALLLSILILGLISRTLPQLNVMAVGFSLNAMVMLAVLSVSLGGIVWAFQNEVGATLTSLRDAMSVVD